MLSLIFLFIIFKNPFIYLYMMSIITRMRPISKKNQKYPSISKKIIFNSLMKAFNPFMKVMSSIIGKIVT
jgi:hypothetical protein